MNDDVKKALISSDVYMAVIESIWARIFSFDDIISNSLSFITLLTKQQFPIDAGKNGLNGPPFDLLVTRSVRQRHADRYKS